jgi:hypothetical protein
MSGRLESFDMITYAGEISMDGYEALSTELKSKKSAEKALLVLATPGGDPHAGFRIARALQSTYGSFEALVPRYCKSAGTLILVGASRLYLADMSELGPLDIQVKKGDEVLGRNSGLDILQAVNYLQSQTMVAFKHYLIELTVGAGLSTKVGSDIATRLAVQLFEPISAQIDPLKLAEMQRANEIAMEYGARLAHKGGNVRQGGIESLVSGYPSHGFVIDRKEAKKIFVDALRPEGFYEQLSDALHASMEEHVEARPPKVAIRTLGVPNEAEQPENPPDASDRSKGDGAGERTVDEDRDGSVSPTQDEPRAIHTPS